MERKVTSLAGELIGCHPELVRYLHIGYARWDDLIARVKREEQTPSPCFGDEQIWTFLVACGYAASGERGVARLARILTDSDQKIPRNPKIWFEVVPIAPREREGETHIDLALGSIAVRPGTESGIQLDNGDEFPWVCFCEMKWYSDISGSVTYDVHRNQLARVIENALCFQSSGTYSEKVHVTIVTPSMFRNASLKSRLYQYKFEEYVKNRTSLMADLNACVLEKNNQAEWLFPPDIVRRATTLHLMWATYDEVFKNVPDSPIAGQLEAFWREHGGYQGRAVTA